MSDPRFVAGPMTRHALKKRTNQQAHALANLERSVARALEVGVEPRVLNETVGGSVKGALKALLDDSKAFLLAKQLYDGASDPTNPRQLDYISRVKEWTDGHETKVSKTESVSQRISLTLGGTSVGVPVPVDDGKLARLEQENKELRELLLRISETVGIEYKRGLSEASEDVSGELPPAAPLATAYSPDVVPPETGVTAAPSESSPGK